jgi:hypothetical protein
VLGLFRFPFPWIFCFGSVKFGFGSVKFGFGVYSCRFADFSLPPPLTAGFRLQPLEPSPSLFIWDLVTFFFSFLIIGFAIGYAQWVIHFIYFI